MSTAEIIQVVNEFFRKELLVENTDLTPDTELKRDIGLTSVDAIAIATFAERRFACPIIMPELKAILTMQDLYEYINRHQQK